MRKALDDPAVKEKLKGIGAYPLLMSPEEFGTFVKKEVDINATLVKASGVKINSNGMMFETSSRFGFLLAHDLFREPLHTLFGIMLACNRASRCNC